MMVLKNKYFSHNVLRYIAFTVVIVVLNSVGNVLSQRVVSVGAQMSAGFSSIKTSMPGFLAETGSKGGFAVNFGISGQYFLNKKYGILSGIRYHGFNQTSTGTSSYQSFDEVDSEDQPYERRVWGKDIVEKASLGIIHIPAQFFYFHPFSRSVAMYASVGPGFSFPIKKSYTGSGVFTYKGYYHQLGVLLDSIPYGFSTNVPVNTTQQLRSRFVVINVGATLGVAFTINRYYKFNTAINYYRSITNIAKTDKGFHISNEIGSFNSFMQNGINVVSDVSFSIGITKDILF